MADEKRPSLEPPKLFGRRRGTAEESTDDPADSPTEVAPGSDNDTAISADDPGPAPAAQETDTPTTVDVEAVEHSGDQDTPASDVAATPDPVTDSGPPPEAEPTPEPEPEPAASPEPSSAEFTELLPADPATDEVAQESPVADTEDATDVDDDIDGEDVAPAPAPSKPRRSLPQLEIWQLQGRVGAAVTGLVVGLVLVALVALGFRACEGIGGGNSCGTAPGLLLLALVFAAAVLAGRYLLALLKLPDPGATSFLAMGLVGVVSMLFLIDHLDRWWMALVIPAVSAGAYVFSWWVTTTFVDDSI